MIFTSGLPLAVHSRVAESYWLTITDLEGQGEFHKGTVDISHPIISYGNGSQNRRSQNHSIGLTISHYEICLSFKGNAKLNTQKQQCLPG